MVIIGDTRKSSVAKLLAVMMFTTLIFLTTFSANALAAKKAPNFTLKDMHGKTVKLSSYRGKVVYLDFWASWCKPCVKSFPWMNRIQAKYKKKGLVVLAVNLDKDKSLAWKFLKENRSNFKVLRDPDGDIAEKYEVIAMPSSYLIDKRGRIQKVHYGFLQKDSKNKELEIADLLK